MEVGEEAAHRHVSNRRKGVVVEEEPGEEVVLRPKEAVSFQSCPCPLYVVHEEPSPEVMREESGRKRRGWESRSARYETMHCRAQSRGAQSMSGCESGSKAKVKATTRSRFREVTKMRLHDKKTKRVEISLLLHLAYSESARTDLRLVHPRSSAWAFLRSCPLPTSPLHLFSIRRNLHPRCLGCSHRGDLPGVGVEEVVVVHLHGTGFQR